MVNDEEVLANLVLRGNLVPQQPQLHKAQRLTDFFRDNDVIEQLQPEEDDDQPDEDDYHEGDFVVFDSKKRRDSF